MEKKAQACYQDGDRELRSKLFQILPFSSFADAAKEGSIISQQQQTSSSQIQQSQQQASSSPSLASTFSSSSSNTPPSRKGLSLLGKSVSISSPNPAIFSQPNPSTPRSDKSKPIDYQILDKLASGLFSHHHHLLFLSLSHSEIKPNRFRCWQQTQNEKVDAYKQANQSSQINRHRSR